MRFDALTHRGLRILLLATFTLVLAAPAAHAGHRGGVRYKGYDPYVHRPRVVHAYAYRPVYVERHYHSGPAFAGFLGGLVLGAAISNASPACEPGYAYYDPYCHERFASLDLYYGHVGRHRHPRVVQVIEVESGRYVDTRAWDDGRWVSRGDWDDEDDD
ncbi:MAG: hypothetical protein HZC42_02125 [Candidatus Eisenbacteria bacterium]|nr:hypothetical protein [Candidatus Eisenbacteria bacterium]